MDPQGPWDSARWREGGHHQPHDRSRAPPLSAPTAINPASQSAILDRYSHDTHSWDARSQAFTDRRLSEQHPLNESHTDASAFPSRPHERHTPAPSGNYEPQQHQVTTSPRPPPTGAWRSLHPDQRRFSTTQLADAPLTLHIPHGQDLPRIASAHTAIKSEGQPYTTSIPTPSQSAPSLPSFASLQEHASRLEDPDADGPEIAPMASRLSCYSCTKLKPMVRDVAMAVAELDDSVQSHCNKGATRTLDIPSDSPMRAFQWILDRLRYAKRDIQEAARPSNQPAYLFPHPPAPTGGLNSHPSSPHASLKRQAAWEDYPATKRPKSDDSPDEGSRTTAASMGYHGDRRASIDYLPRNVYSPPAGDSAPHSAYPRYGSPGMAGRPLRPLPSPSSLAYPLSAATSLPPPTVHAGSPAPSFPASTSIHTTSTNSATSAHIADLQHQVTLKSLALQTLQSEYSGLLQKLQREKVKSQTIEKKTTVSEQEVNDLTGRNEELTEQVKSLEMQVDESERKRENDRLDAAKEKDQWGRMLDMSGRLQAKLSTERQSLSEERDELRKRMATLENQWRGQPSHVADGAEAVDLSQQESAFSRQAGHVYGSSSSDAVALKQETAVLKAKVELLMSALLQTRRHNHDLKEKTRNLMNHSGEIDEFIGKALGDKGRESPKANGAEQSSAPHTGPASAYTEPQRPVPANGTPPIMVSNPGAPPKLAPLGNTHSNNGTSPLPRPTSATGPSIADMASAGRAISPGPEELGIHVQPSISSPEELIRALGPIPTTALPPFRFAAGAAPYHGPIGRQETNPYGFSSMKTKTRSPPGTQSGAFPNYGTNDGRTYLHSSPYGPSPYAGQHPQYRTSETSPPSNHSSPNSASARDDASNSSSHSIQRPSTERAGREDTMPFPEQGQRFRRFPDMPTTASTGLASFRQWNPESKAAMPPPPRPFSNAQNVGFGQTSGS